MIGVIIAKSDKRYIEIAKKIKVDIIVNQNKKIQIIKIFILISFYLNIAFFDQNL